jgi:hypothetical protein
MSSDGAAVVGFVALVAIIFCLGMAVTGWLIVTPSQAHDMEDWAAGRSWSLLGMVAMSIFLFAIAEIMLICKARKGKWVDNEGDFVWMNILMIILAAAITGILNFAQDYGGHWLTSMDWNATSMSVLNAMMWIIGIVVTIGIFLIIKNLLWESLIAPARRVRSEQFSKMSKMRKPAIKIPKGEKHRKR